MEMVMHLSGCTQEEAEQALHECNGDVVDAIDKLIKTLPTVGAPKKKELDETQKKFTEMRKVLDKMNNVIEDGFKKKDQPGCSSSQESQHSLDHHQEALWSDSHHTPQNQILIPELEEQKQGTACQ